MEGERIPGGPSVRCFGFTVSLTHCAATNNNESNTLGQITR
jgi:hypothetical protein